MERAPGPQGSTGAREIGSMIHSWLCDVCGRVGVVFLPEGVDAWAGAQFLLGSHASMVPWCWGGRYEIQVRAHRTQAEVEALKLVSR